MRGRFIAGYILLIIGILASLFTGGSLINVLSSPPPTSGGIAGAFLIGLGVAILIGAYVLSGLIFLIPGSLLVRVHEGTIRKIFGIIILILSLGIPIALVATGAEPLIIPILAIFHLPAAAILLTGRGKPGLILFIVLLAADVLMAIAGF